MKRIGILGGLGPEATVDYYKEIINAFKKEGIEIVKTNFSRYILFITTYFRTTGKRI